MSNLLIVLGLVKQVNSSIGANSSNLAGRIRVGSRCELLVVTPSGGFVLDDAVKIHELVCVVQVYVSFKVGDSETCVGFGAGGVADVDGCWNFVRIVFCIQIWIFIMAGAIGGGVSRICVITYTGQILLGIL
jgi:hypothetical protein